MTLLDLPPGVDWKGSHETLEEFLNAVYHSCEKSNYLRCGKDTTCGQCALMNDQRYLDRLIEARYRFAPSDPRSRVIERSESNWPLS